MFITKIRNANGEIINLTEATDRFVVSSIIGLNPPKAQINTTNIVGLDGSKFNSAFMGNRNIVLTMILRGDQEANRQELLQYFRCKGLCRFYFQNNNRNICTDGYIESVEYNIFQRQIQVQVSIICPDAYFYDLTQRVIPLTDVTSQFYFPFAIDEDDPVELSTYSTQTVATIVNEGEADSGMILVVKFNSSADSFVLRNIDTWESFSISYSFSAGDIMTFSTIPENIVFTLLGSGTEVNLFHYAYIGDVDLIKIHPGTNRFEYAVNNVPSSSAVDATIVFRQAYQGV